MQLPDAQMFTASFSNKMTRSASRSRNNFLAVEKGRRKSQIDGFFNKKIF